MNDRKTRLYVGTFLALCVLLWAGVLYLRGVPIALEHLWPFTVVLGTVTALVGLFSRYLWSLRPLHGWFVERPDLRGTWRGELLSDWEDPQTKSRRPPIICYVGATQSLFRLNLHLMTAESASDFIAHTIRALRGSTSYEVIGVYQNTPDVHLRQERSPIHFGTLRLETHGTSRSRPQRLEGEYWTDRKTLGTMKLFWCTRELHTRFADADAALRDKDCPAR